MTDVIVILAGGKGSRITKLIGSKAKATVEFDGIPFIIKFLSYLEGQGFKKYIFVLGNYSEQIIHELKQSKFWQKCELVVEDNPRGTGPALLAGLDRANRELVFLSNADTFIAFDRLQMSELAKKKEQSVVLKAHELLVIKDIHKNKDTFVSQLSEPRSTGVLVLQRSHVEMFRAEDNPEGSWRYEERLLPYLYRLGLVMDKFSSNQFFDYGSIENLAYLMTAKGSKDLNIRFETFDII